MTDALTPAVSDVGELWIRRDSDGDLYMVRADPEIEISADMLGNAAIGSFENATYEPGPQILTFKAANGTWRYRVTGRLPDRPAFRAERIDDESTDNPSVLGNNTTTTPATEAAGQEEEENDGR